jgi:hypothetical protein
MPKNILIIGDSWGLGAFKIANGAMELVPNTGIESYLSSIGHTVSNISKAGGSNTEQLNILTELLENNNQFDYIIWLYTETTRDALYDPIVASTYTELVNLAHRRNFATAQQIYDKHNIPFLVIGGLSVVPQIENTFALTIIPSWLSSLTNDILPLNIHANYLSELLQTNSFNDIAFITSEIDTMIALETKLETHPAFSDGLHPSKESYTILAERISCLI